MNKEIIIKHLNKLLTGELTSIRQYFLHSTILKDIANPKKVSSKSERRYN